ncbi:TrmB family transcriptional regulator [Natrinema salifodinae]|uniref:Sugar-specific transcriptional regulator TrmB n=1 Tax=Natrinema salifodinae TaxID=1202768 RepID=A0A1I0M7M2_9EURY|nr:helix-turn-helix domain-containing protein [Natrinema salifodinae]SEV84475.1 Sugar-specific transcriptional regulator TrmB [Natrinema salifodinae]
MSEAEAVDALVELGLRQYEAQCFVALAQLSEGTAKEISRVADVPQSRVYDVVDELHRLGLVDVQESDPRKYSAVPVDVARNRLRQKYRNHLETATTHLQALERRTLEEDGAWKVASDQDVRNRTIQAVEDATSEIYLLAADGEVLESALLDRLAAARERDVTVFVEVPSSDDRDRIHDAVATVQVAVTDFEFDSQVTTDRSLGRLLVVDRQTVVVSALTTGIVPSQRAETGIWTSERGHGLVAWFRYFLERRLAQLAFETGNGRGANDERDTSDDDANAECTACEE